MRMTETSQGETVKPFTIREKGAPSEEIREQARRFYESMNRKAAAPLITAGKGIVPIAPKRQQ